LEADLVAAIEVEAAAFGGSATRMTLRRELARGDLARVFIVRAAMEPVVGYCSAWLIADELHINSLAVRAAWRRRGAARALLAHVLEDARGGGATRVTLEVRPSNLAARRLYDRLGFTLAGTRPAYYTDPREDALILWREQTPRAPVEP